LHFLRPGALAQRHAQSFFQRDAVALEESPERCDPDVHASLAELSLEFGKRNIGLLGHRIENEGGLRLDALRPAVATARLPRPRLLMWLATLQSAHTGVAMPWKSGASS
jgi:hypothetical protein